MFRKSLEKGQFWDIKVAAFGIENPDSLGIKSTNTDSFFYQGENTYTLMIDCISW